MKLKTGHVVMFAIDLDRRVLDMGIRMQSVAISVFSGKQGRESKFLKLIANITT